MSKPLPTALVWLALLVAALFPAGPVEARRASSKQLDKTLFEYASNLRWSEYEAAWSLVEPAYREANPLDEADLEQYGQYSVSGYLVKRRESLGKQDYLQVVEIRLIDKQTMTERVLTERERWRWDAKAKRWWLTTGLPKLPRD